MEETGSGATLNAASGADNTGGGGGGSGSGLPAGSGGSGIIIVKYPIP